MVNFDFKLAKAKVKSALRSILVTYPSRFSIIYCLTEDTHP